MKHIIRTVALVLVVCMLSVTAFAAENFTPSVEQKGSPEVVDGKAELIVKGDDDKVVESDNYDCLVVTPLSKIKDLAPEAKEQMEKAFTQISEAKSLAEVAPELTDVLKELKVETPVEDLVVRDLFHIAVSEKLAKALETEGNVLPVSFELELAEGEQLIVLVQNAEGEWLIVSGDAVVAEDGFVTVDFPCVGPVAFIVV